MVVVVVVEGEGENGVKEKEEWLAAGVRGGELRAVESGTL